MKNLFCFVFSFTCSLSNAQTGKDTEKHPTEINAAAYNNEIIVKFDPKLIDRSVINNLEKQEGLVTDFINPKLLPIIQSSQFFTKNLSQLSMRRVHTRLSANDTISITRFRKKNKNS